MIKFKIKMPKGHGEKVRQSLLGRKESFARNWKGDNAGYVAIHIWLKQKLGKATKCENPNCIYPKRNNRNEIIDLPKRFEWASISRKSKRDITDYIQLCPSCHRVYDINNLTLEELYATNNKV